jgi:hypothetical protein
MSEPTYASRSEAYQAYLRSDHWKRLRRRKLNRNPCCENCQRGYLLQVHHLHYPEDWTKVRIYDLETLCGFCHAAGHGKAFKAIPAWLKKQKPIYLSTVPNKKQVLSFRDGQGRKRPKTWITWARREERLRLMRVDASRSNTGYIVFPEDRLFGNSPAG